MLAAGACIFSTQAVSLREQAILVGILLAAMILGIISCVLVVIRQHMRQESMLRGIREERADWNDEKPRIASPKHARGGTTSYSGELRFVDGVQQQQMSGTSVSPTAQAVSTSLLVFQVTKIEEQLKPSSNPPESNLLNPPTLQVSSTPIGVGPPTGTTTRSVNIQTQIQDF
jgi:hypothetical protein